MPTYVYKCEACEHVHEVYAAFKDYPGNAVKCTQCTSDAFQYYPDKYFTSEFLLKGKGFYKPGWNK